MKEFYGEVAEILEVDEVTGSDVLASYGSWDSLSVLSVIAMISSRYGVNLTARNIKGVATAGELYELVLAKAGVEKTAR